MLGNKLRIWYAKVKNKRILLLGVTGHSGQYAIERLAQRRSEMENVTLRALVRPTSDSSFIESFGLPIEIVRGDIQDDDCLRSALSGMDTLLNVFGIIQDPARVTKMAVEAGVTRIISVHTTGIYSRYKYASADYIESDRKVTELCREHGVALSILRPTMIYGGLDDQNVSTFIRMMDRLPIMPVVAGARFPLQPVNRRDLGYAYADVLLAGEATENRDYTLSGAEPVLLRDMLTIIAEQLGKKAKFLSVPYWVSIAGAWMLYVLSFTKVDFREKVQRMVEPRAYPHDAATADFGYAPRGFAEGVHDEIAEYKKTR